MKSTLPKYTSIVNQGQQLGRTLGFPTLNLDPQVLPFNQKPGVYQAHLTCQGREYRGVLFFGPKKTLAEVETVLEIYVLDFNQEVYGETISFSLGKFIRPPVKFSSIAELKKQISQDVAAAWPA